MKFFVVFATVLACALAADESSAPIVKSNYDISPEGSFQYEYETGNGINARAGGQIKNPNSEYPAQSVEGAFAYKSPEGEQIQLVYIADEEGFKPQGSHLPTPPPTPEGILRGLAYIAAHPPPPESPARAQSGFGK